MIRCLFCGADNEEGSKFCSKCGNSLQNTNNFDFRQQNNQQQNYESRGQNDPRRIDERQHVSNQQQTYGQSGNKDPRRIDERHHVSNNPQINNRQQVNNKPQVNNRQPVDTRPQVNNQQQGTYRNTNNNSNGSILDKISNLSLPVKIIGFIAICCIGILIVTVMTVFLIHSAKPTVGKSIIKN